MKSTKIHLMSRMKLSVLYFASEFILSPTNKSYVIDEAEYKDPVGEFSSVQIFRIKEKCHRQLALTGETTKFQFITSDGVYQDEMSLITLTSPFELDVWTVLFVSMGLSFILQIIIYWNIQSPYSQFVCGMLFSAAFWIWRIFLGQSDEEEPHRVRQANRKFLSIISRILFGFWFVMGVVMTTVYRGVLKFSYTADYPMLIPWSRLEELKLNKYQIFVAEANVPCPDENEKENSGEYLFPFTWTKYDRCVTEEKKRENGTSNCQMILDIMEMLQRAKVTFVEELEEKLISGDLSHTKSLLLVPKNEFFYFWNKFEKAMKKNDGLKFSNNMGKKDDYLTMSTGFIFEAAAGLAEKYRNVIYNRMKILLSSGLYGIQEKWIRYGLGQKNIKIAIQVRNEQLEGMDGKMKVSEYAPLSVYGSAVHLVIKICAGVLLVAFWVLLMELGVSKIMVWMKKLALTIMFLPRQAWKWFVRGM